GSGRPGSRWRPGSAGATAASAWSAGQSAAGPSSSTSTTTKAAAACSWTGRRGRGRSCGGSACTARPATAGGPAGAVRNTRPGRAPCGPDGTGDGGERAGGRGGWWASDDFNLRGDWEAVLAPKGWVPLHTSGDVTYWRRPDKADGASATTNYAGRDLVHVFT